MCLISLNFNILYIDFLYFCLFCWIFFFTFFLVDSNIPWNVDYFCTYQIFCFVVNLLISFTSFSCWMFFYLLLNLIHPVITSILSSSWKCICISIFYIWLGYSYFVCVCVCMYIFVFVLFLFFACLKLLMITLNFFFTNGRSLSNFLIFMSIHPVQSVRVSCFCCDILLFPLIS